MSKEKFSDKIIDLKNEYSSLRSSILVSISSVKEIFREARFFIIDGKISTYSTYKIGSKVLYNSEVDQDAIEFVEKMLKIWMPTRAFVIDIALTENGYRVIGINTINSSGFYAIDVQKIVIDIENMNYKICYGYREYEL